jgi:uncharacterized membrane protein YqhA
MVTSRPRLESALEQVLLGSRWLLAPFYAGMVLALAAVLVVFVRELVAGLRPRLRAP